MASNTSPPSMRLFAVLVGIGSLAALWAGAWLGWHTLRFATGGDYALVHEAAGSGNGYGIFVPALLLLAVGVFLARFARDLWKS